MIWTGTRETPRMTTAAATVMTGYAAVNPLTTLAVPDSIARNQKIEPKHPQTALAVANATPSGVKRSQPDPRTNPAARIGALPSAHRTSMRADPSRTVGSLDRPSPTP